MQVLLVGGPGSELRIRALESSASNQKEKESMEEAHTVFNLFSPGNSENSSHGPT